MNQVRTGDTKSGMTGLFCCIESINRYEAERKKWLVLIDTISGTFAKERILNWLVVVSFPDRVPTNVSRYHWTQIGFSLKRRWIVVENVTNFKTQSNTSFLLLQRHWFTSNFTTTYCLLLKHTVFHLTAMTQLQSVPSTISLSLLSWLPLSFSASLTWL